MMGLTGNALRAAFTLKARYPNVKLTSGRRTVTEQALAMAANLEQDRGWLAATYKPSKAKDACQAWLDAHPFAELAEMKIGLGTVLRSLPDAELGKLSKHLSGEAFDVRPIDGPQGVEVLEFLRLLAKKFSGTLLEKEGSLVRWHLQF